MMFRALWSYRGFVLGAVRREFQLKYRGSTLGVLWAVLNPLAMILVFTLVFASVMKPSLPGHESNRFAYSIYLCVGVLPWGLFAEMLGRLNTVFIENANLIKKASFPRICLPVIVTLSALINFSVVLGIFTVFLLLIGQFPGWIAVAALPVLAAQVLLALGLGLALGTLNVFFRDVGQLTGVALQFWFWLTPIVYVATTLPESIVRALGFNPMWPIIRGYQSIFVEGVAPAWGSVGLIALGSTAVLSLAGAIFLRLSGEMVDEL